MPQLLPSLPRRFCWTKYGSEAGESVDQILMRKEQERVSNDGIFLWGIGNSVAPGVRRLIELESEPVVVFSPMRASAKQVDARPETVVRWRDAKGLDGRSWQIPSGSVVTSRATSTPTKQKKAHYALVCRANVPLKCLVTAEVLVFEALRNLESGNPLGFSQVTSVVEHQPALAPSGLNYHVGFMAALVFPYFVELSTPEYLDGRRVVPTAWPDIQRDLSPAW